ncbi:MAG: EF-P lysine aminoacylase GenX [Deltaproteobacteria bacterium]|nr:EF-P lysine aminoacylase GenX [Deltaproteobacteria bacterium]
MHDISCLAIRSRTIQSIREFFTGRGYLEVETPVLVPAPAPEANIDAIEASGWFLQTSPELCMKRLLATGYTRIFQVCKCFRAAERGERHLPEFTMLEWYRAGVDYLFLMDECEELIRHAARVLDKGDIITYQGKNIDISGSWDRITVRDAFLRYAGETPEKAIEAGTFDEIMVTQIEPGLNKGKPVFLYDYPASQAGFSRTKNSDKSLAERFELYMGGLELANAFTELIDVAEQKKRFLAELDSRAKKGKTAYPFPKKFINDLEYMPPSAGIAFGIDRFIMLLTDSPSIDEVVAFTPEKL